MEVACSAWLTRLAGPVRRCVQASGEGADAADGLSDSQLLATAQQVLVQLFGAAVPSVPGVVCSKGLSNATDCYKLKRWRADDFAGGAGAFATVNSTASDWAAASASVEHWLHFAGEYASYSLRGTMQVRMMPGSSLPLDAIGEVVRCLPGGHAACAWLRSVLHCRCCRSREHSPSAVCNRLVPRRCNFLLIFF